ncbi:hypothetical protein [Micromonospora sp. AMSO31t]|uniref:hypothetical protein n=1 Tax=Micromonospora sp. AMSO31t TaxID=2650566 RepID=UPI00124BBE78|nr:hypothetical protein [Micromonospora sp. AMSO31t]KAB1906895.1 hypothetical protein F8274_25025 [Micromonospora sp. AMSO31t]
MIRRHVARLAGACAGVVALLVAGQGAVLAAPRSGDLTPTVVNDDFAAALPVDALPYSNVQDLSTATAQDGEPTSCFGATRTVWYAYTPTTTGMVTAGRCTATRR